MSDAFRLTAVRLVNWHNFVDETVVVEGSLFLIGDNGCGKTTFLDAVHCALTGDWLVELNAAARVGGRRDVGRDLVGIVLRHDVEQGYQRAGGAVAYAALEFRRAPAQRRPEQVLSLGIGVYAAGPESRPDKWGFIVALPLAEVPLVVCADATVADARGVNGSSGRRPADRAELQARLGAGQVCDIGRYRTRVGERLYGSRENLAEVASFLRAGKAYRELVAKTTNFSELFAGLLSTPDVEVFHEVRRALEAIERTRVDLLALDEELALLRALLDWLANIAEEREAVARYEYLEARHAKEVASERQREAALFLEDRELERTTTEDERRTADARLEALEDEAARLRASQGFDLLAQLEELRHQERRARDDEARHAGRVDEHARHLAAQETSHRAAVDEVRARVARLHAVVARVRARIATEVDAECLERIGRLAERFAALALEPATVVFDDAAADDDRRTARRAVTVRVAGLREEARRESESAEREARLAEAAEARAGELERRGEVDPPLDGIVDALAALRSEGIEATPLYRLLEPRGRLSLDEAGAIERALGPRLLGTLVTAEADHDRARAILLASHPGVPLAFSLPQDAANDTLAPLESLGDGPSVFDALVIGAAHDARAVAESFLRHHTRALGWRDESSAADESSRARAGSTPGTELAALEEAEDFLTRRGHLHHRRFDARVPRGPALWLGERARRKAFEAAVAAARRESRDASERSRAHRGAASAAEARAVTLDESEHELDRLDLLPLTGDLARRDELARSVERERRDLGEARGELERAIGRLEGLRGTLAALEAEVEAQGLGNLARRVEEVEQSIRSLREALKGLVERQGARREAARAAREAFERASETEAASAVPFARARQSLLSLVPAEARGELDDWVLRVKRGRLVKPENYASNREDHGRRIAALVERVSHAEGVRHRHLWQKYAFVYDEGGNRLTDSTGKDVAEVTGALERQVDELSGVLRGRNEELLERVVLEELVGTLRSELRNLQDTVRDVNALMGDLTFGNSRYRVDAKLRSDFKRLQELLERSSALGAASKDALREHFSSRLDEFTAAADGELPESLDYRRWYEFNLRVSTLDSDGVVLSQDRLRQGSGGEQAVPSYLLLFCLTKLLYDGFGGGARFLLLDEAFYGIDAGRRDALLRFARRAGIELIVATPEMDGVTEALASSTTILIEKTPANDVFLTDVRYRSTRESLFDAPEPEAASFVIGVPAAADRDDADAAS